MTKLLEVREFERISCNPDFKTEYAYLPEEVFGDLEEFIHVFTADEEHADALELICIMSTMRPAALNAFAIYSEENMI